ncbi:hypothetical protein [Oerskovia turbata]
MTTTTTRHVETMPLSKVRLRDVPGVAWTLAVGFTPRTRGGAARERLLPVATWLFWCAHVLVLPGMRHRDRLVVARVGRRSLGAQLVVAARFVGLVVVVEVVGLAIAIALDTLGWWGSHTVWILVLLGAWLVVSAVTAVALLAPTGARIWAQGAAARRVLDEAQVAADVEAFKSARWTVDSVASRLPRGGLTLVVAHARATVPPGETVVTQAASASHVPLYTRYGLTPLAVSPWTLIGSADPHA